MKQSKQTTTNELLQNFIAGAAVLGAGHDVYAEEISQAWRTPR